MREEEELEEIPHAVDEDHAVNREPPAKTKRGGATQLVVARLSWGLKTVF